MKKILFIMGLLILSANLYAKEWYEEKGTLHQATMKAWCQADAKNKLATAGSFVAASYQNKMLKPELMDAIQEHGMPGIKIMATEVVEGLDSAACNGKKVSKGMAKTKVSEMSATLIVLMGWTAK